MTPAPPLVLPRSFLDRPDVRHALANRDFGTAFRLATDELDQISNRKIALACGIKHERVGRIIRGQMRITSLDKIEEIADGLRIPGHLLGLASRPWEQTTPPVPPQAPPSANLGDPTSSEASLGFADTLADTADAALIDDLSDQLRHLAVCYVHAPLPPLLPRLVALRDTAIGHYQAGVRPRHAQQLLVILGATTTLLAHGAQNIGDRRAATAHLVAARRYADHADHTPLRAWITGSAALIAEWTGQASTAAELAARSFHHAPHGHTAVRAAAIEARAAARVGDHARALLALDRLQHAADRPPADDDLGVHLGGLFAFPDAKRAYYIGGTYRLLGRADQCLDHTSTALELYRTGPETERSYGDQALATVDAICAHLGRGELDGAQPLLQDLLGLPEELRIQQLAPALAPITQALARPRVRATPLVSDMAAQLEAFAPACVPHGLPWTR
ncbi:hypothetical protein AB0I72_26850 [Nocardiopsis sp. NPDC049922]|uniref:hypothetical protein n=1 Tax=Nocardiopsis sp. NPDC049922 TaxID=3155157 RepID=UPI0033CC09FA